MFRRPVRSDEGFGLVELIIAMAILSVGLTSLIAAFSASSVALRRASTVSTAAVLADQQMELYRAIRYSAITLDSASIPTDQTYTGDVAYDSTAMVQGYCAEPPVPNECNASRTATGPDLRSYRVDTYIVTEIPATDGRTLKRITVVVRDGVPPHKTHVRVSSTFDESTGS